MAGANPTETWSNAETYDAFVGRWSRLVATELLAWLAVPTGRRWLDLGCGSGALTETILRVADPAGVVGIDPSEPFIEYDRSRIDDIRARFEVGDAQAIPLMDGTFDAVVAGLVLNFVPDPSLALAEMTRVAGVGGVVAAYVWDYADGMEFIRRFWDAAVELDPAAAELDETNRFSLCAPEPLARLFGDAGLTGVATRAIEVPTVFRDFDDLWGPFLGGQGPAPTYAMSLDPDRREAIRDRLRSMLPPEADGSIRLRGRAWAVKAVSPSPPR